MMMTAMRMPGMVLGIRVRLRLAGGRGVRMIAANMQQLSGRQHQQLQERNACDGDHPN